jgi:hypothetical protein
MWAHKTIAWTAVLTILIVAAAPVSADSLDFDGTAWGGWEGQASFYSNNPVSGATLSGDVNWIVYNNSLASSQPGSFPASYSSYCNSYNYSPTQNEFVYVYQIVSTGNDTISNFSVGLSPNGLGDNLGWFGVSSDQVDPQDGGAVSHHSAFWDFTGDELDPTQPTSDLLVFSSPQSPQDLFGVLQDSGLQARVESVGGPGPGGMIVITAPEPSMALLMGIGFGTWAAAWVARRRQGRQTRI